MKYLVVVLMLLATACSRLPVTGDPGDDDSSAVAQTVKVIDVTSPMQLTSYDGTDTWTFTDAASESLAAGQILVSVKNDGYLIKVDSVSTVNGKTTVSGTPATLEDLIETCTIDTQASLDSDSVDFSGISVLGGNLSGSVRISPRMGLQLAVSDHQVTDLTFSAAGQLKAALVCSAGYASVLTGNAEAAIYNDAVPVVMWVGDVPVLAVLDLAITGTVTGSPLADIAGAGVSGGFAYNGSFQTSLSFDGASWNASGTCDTAFTAIGSTAVTGLSDSVKFRLSTRLTCRIYNTAGPSLMTGVYGMISNHDQGTGWNASAGIRTSAFAPVGNISDAAGVFQQTVMHTRRMLRQGNSTGSPPDAPTPLTPANAALNMTAPVSFTWSAPVNADRYVVYIMEKSSYDTVNVPTLTVAELDPMTKYHWSVQAVNEWGAGAWSATRYFSITGEAPTPLEPVAGASLQDSVVLFKWSSVSGAADYTLTFARSADFTGNDVQTISSGGETAVAGTLKTAAVTAGATIYWKVQATAPYCESPWSAVDSFTVPGPAPAAPVLKTPANATLNMTIPVTFTWSGQANADWYVVYIMEKSSYDTVTSPFLKVSNLEPMTKYHWQVQAGNQWGAGSWSAIRYFSTTGPGPVIYEPSLGEVWDDTTVIFKWSSISGAVDYRVKYSQTADFSGNDVNILQSGGATDLTTAITSYSGAMGGTMLYWQVQGFHQYSKSAWSAVDSFYLLSHGPVLPAAPVVTGPDSGTVVSADIPITLQWQTVPGADEYEIELAPDGTFGTIIQSQTGILYTHYQVTGLTAGRLVYWRVRAVSSDIPGAWSSTAFFETK